MGTVIESFTSSVRHGPGELGLIVFGPSDEWRGDQAHGDFALLSSSPLGCIVLRRGEVYQMVDRGGAARFPVAPARRGGHTRGMDGQDGDYADTNLPRPQWPTLGQLALIGVSLAVSVGLPIAVIYLRSRS